FPILSDDTCFQAAARLLKSCKSRPLAHRFVTISLFARERMRCLAVHHHASRWNPPPYSRSISSQSRVTTQQSRYLHESASRTGSLLVGSSGRLWRSSSRCIGVDLLGLRRNTFSAAFTTEEEQHKELSTRIRGSKLKDDGLTLSHFIARSSGASAQEVSFTRADTGSSACKPPTDADTLSNVPTAADIGDEFDDVMVTDAMSCSAQSTAQQKLSDSHLTALDRLKYPFLSNEQDTLSTFKFHIKTYGCQMNVNDSDIVRSILLNHNNNNNNNNNNTSDTPNIKFIETDDEIQADILLTNTCAIRENAEQKVWHRLMALRSHDRKYPLPALQNSSAITPIDLTKEQGKRKQPKHTKKRIIGVLGCMAERLKEEMFQDGTADLVVGPDAYRDLPRLISILGPERTLSSKERLNLPTERAVNVQLSLDETYASITPVRSNPQDVSAFVSIMRGCNNMCSYCVVPFTRGRERSRDMASIVDETRRLLEEEGIKEVILLGQNKRKTIQPIKLPTRDSPTCFAFVTAKAIALSIFLMLSHLSRRSSEYDYPPPLLTLMAERPNICSHLHMPAQSGSSTVLERMRRGYTREAYLELIEDVRRLIPDVAISSDFVSGFCGETEQEHQDTLSLIEKVQFDQAFMTMRDDVSPEVKNRRLNEVISVFRREVQTRNNEMEVGKLRLVLVEGEAKKSTPEEKMWSGRTDQNKRCVFPDSQRFWMEEEVRQLLSRTLSSESPFREQGMDPLLLDNASDILRTPVGFSKGDYVVVRITEARGHTLKGQGLWRSSIAGFDEMIRGHYGNNLNLTRLFELILPKQIFLR
ncbi:hypothetical protein ACHAW6_015632, partial [Cyclotella cf. meneghiniana]